MYHRLDRRNIYYILDSEYFIWEYIRIRIYKRMYIYPVLAFPKRQNTLALLWPQCKQSLPPDLSSLFLSSSFSLLSLFLLSTSRIVPVQSLLYNHPQPYYSLLTTHLVSPVSPLSHAPPRDPWIIPHRIASCLPHSPTCTRCASRSSLSLRNSRI